jgi:pimeloyl-ACP methyl ester carboxylesterase
LPKAVINGVELAYDVTGSGPPLVYVHGGFGGIATRFETRVPWWANEVFAPHYTVVTYDRRGCGRSESPPGPYYMETLVADLHSLLRHLDLEQAAVMGSSAGGPIAMQFALTHPEMTRLLVLVNTAADLLCGDHGAEARKRLAEREEQRPDMLPELPAEADEQTRAHDAWLREQVAAVPLDQRERVFEAWQANVRAYEDVDLTPLLTRLPMPAYIIHGMSDELIAPAAAYKIGHRIPRATTRILAGEGHGILDRRESEAAQYILDWMLAKDEELLAGVIDDDDDGWGPDGPPRYS